MGKWIEIRDLDRPAASVAAEILEERLQFVKQMLPLAAQEYESDIEHVHQLRVACRRTDAALGAFKPLLTSRSKQLRRGLRKIRQAAGPARDTDVLLERLWSEEGDRSCHAYLVARLERQRHKVQPALVKVAGKVSGKAGKGKLNKSADRCIAALRKKSIGRHAVGFPAFAHDAMRQASRKMFELAELELPTVAQLHRLRIAGKRLRYSIELFHGVFPKMLREEVYPLVEEIQSRLGRLNDHATAQYLFQQWLADLPANDRAAQLAQRVVEEYEATEQIREEYLQWWTSDRVVDLESHLSDLIHESHDNSAN